METPAFPPRPADATAVSVDHTRRVAASADQLLHRFHAVRALGTLHGEPRPLESFTPEVG